MNILMNIANNAMQNIQLNLNKNIENINKTNQDIKHIQNINNQTNEVRKSNQKFSIHPLPIKNNNSESLIKNIYHLHAKEQFETAEYNKINRLKNILNKYQYIFSEFIPNFYSVLREQITKQTEITTFSLTTILAANVVIEQIKKLNHELSELYKTVNYMVYYYVSAINQDLNIISKSNALIQTYLYTQKTTETDYSNILNNIIQKRNECINELNAILGSETNITENNFIISINNNFELINNLMRKKFCYIWNEYDSNQGTIAYIEPLTEKKQSIESLITTGWLGGILHFRRKILDSATNKIGQLIVNFACSLNKQNHEGYDINHQPGKNFFSNLFPEVKASIHNKSKHILLSSWSYSNLIQPEKYQLTFLGNNKWKIKKCSDNTNVNYIIKDLDAITSSISFSGITLKYHKTEMVSDDTYLIQHDSNIIDQLTVEATPDTPIALFKNPNDTEDHMLNAQIMYNLHEQPIVNSQETLNESYEKFKNKIQHRTAELQLNTTQKISMSNLLINDQNDKQSKMFNFENISQNIDNLHQNYIANTKVLQIASEMLENTMKVM
ncbi:Flagellar hook-associated protein 1 [Buchnera aphidicola (Eriosoma lanigerum)]|uniref:FlgK family flagellar hook-associated protein n=1 Tax=Buchnera aphidicola TaxID=9 RepID=UPI00346497CA